MKNIFLLFILSTLFFACNETPKLYVSEINFETMGTYGVVKIISDSTINKNQIAKDIDSIFIDFNKSLSTYMDNSIISKYNNGGTVELDAYFIKMFVQSVKIFNETNGAFNPKIKPLYDYWKEIKNSADSIFVDSLVNSIQSFNLSELEYHNIENEDFDNTESSRALDFSAIAKGYGVDVIAYYFDSLDFKNYMVDIGGEVNCKGTNQEGEFWRLGIEEPNEEVRNIYEVIALNNQSMATSGNYRNYKVLDNGQKIVHIINPKTGYPEISNLLSASIIAKTCMEADAYATACIVMGLDTCFQFILNHPELEGYLIYSDENGTLYNKSTEGFKEMLVK